MTAQPRIGSVWARRVPDYPQYDRDFRVTGVFIKGDVTYVEVEDLDGGSLSRGLLEYMLDDAKPVTGDDGTAY
ncbi:hypothetical protein AB0I06_13450 [Streptomyces sp. NPDC050674]|uniref:hypothetical protein n=1 Tax=Streptomyces sp. NPDC050674 TaxID=3157216 RepID=UPI00343B8FB1